MLDFDIIWLILTFIDHVLWHDHDVVEREWFSLFNCLFFESKELLIKEFMSWVNERKLIECQDWANWISSESVEHFAIIFKEKSSEIDNRAPKQSLQNKFMIVFCLSKNFNNTILQEKETCGVIPRTL